MKNKKVLAVLLTSAMAMSTVLAGCGSNGSDSGSTSDKSSAADTSASSAAVDEDGKVNGIMYAEGLPIVDDGDYSFSIFVDGSIETDEPMMWPILKEQTGVDANSFSVS